MSYAVAAGREPEGGLSVQEMMCGVRREKLCHGLSGLLADAVDDTAEYHGIIRRQYHADAALPCSQRGKDKDGGRTSLSDRGGQSGGSSVGRLSESDLF